MLIFASKKLRIYFFLIFSKFPYSLNPIYRIIFFFFKYRSKNQHFNIFLIDKGIQKKKPTLNQHFSSFSNIFSTKPTLIYTI